MITWICCSSLWTPSPRVRCTRTGRACLTLLPDTLQSSPSSPKTLELVSYNTVIVVYWLWTYTKGMYETSNLYFNIYFKITFFKDTWLLVSKILLRQCIRSEQNSVGQNTTLIFNKCLLVLLYYCNHSVKLLFCQCLPRKENQWILI